MAERTERQGYHTAIRLPFTSIQAYVLKGTIIQCIAFGLGTRRFRSYKVYVYAETSNRKESRRMLI